MLTALAIVALSLVPPPTASRINAVTIYPDRAEVTREAQVLVKAGAQEILIGPLPAEMDDASRGSSFIPSCGARRAGCAARRNAPSAP